MSDNATVIIISVITIVSISFVGGFGFGVEHQKKQQCTDKCQVKELELKQQIEEDRWRRSLILEKR